MTLLSYAAAVLTFLVVGTIVGTIIRAIYVAICVYIFKLSDGPYRFFTQFIGEFIGAIVGCWAAYLVFSWFSKIPNNLICFILFGLAWFVGNLRIADEFQPKAQRIGLLFGLLLFFTRAYI